MKEYQNFTTSTIDVAIFRTMTRLVIQESETSGSSSSNDPQVITKQIQSLVKEVSEVRTDAFRLNELRRIFTRLITNNELTFGVPIPNRPSN